MLLVSSDPYLSTMRKLPKKTITQLSEEVKSLLILNVCNDDDDALVNMDHDDDDDDLEVDEEFSETEDETDEDL